MKGWELYLEERFWLAGQQGVVNFELFKLVLYKGENPSSYAASSIML